MFSVLCYILHKRNENENVLAAKSLAKCCKNSSHVLFEIDMQNNIGQSNLAIGSIVAKWGF